ncbi:MAG TPA: sugar-binding domain-containing protein [Bryobacteraceae bacterium]|nr:sugar-binding domain-containing protein [Bryobacteraceae bacterium]
MPRLNVYLSDQVYELANRWKEHSNLSEICARAIKDELGAIEGHRTADKFFQLIRSPNDAEKALKVKYGLTDVVISEVNADSFEIREALGKAAAAYLDQNISDGSVIALAGGRQMWCAVRNLSPRRVKTKITALGMHQTDPSLLHAHPNTLATLIWLLYSPRSEAHVVGSSDKNNPWSDDLPVKPYPTYFVVSSCSSFEEKTSFSQLMGHDAAKALIRKNALGDYAYVFFNKKGTEIDLSLSAPHFRLSALQLKKLSARTDARTILVAGGSEKFEAIRTTLAMRLSNTLITDGRTAKKLLDP